MRRCPEAGTVIGMTIDLPDELGAAVTLRRDLIRDGLTDDAIATLVRRGELHRVRQGAYVDARWWGGLSERDRHRVLMRAVLRRGHPGSVASHVSSAIEHGAEPWGIDLAQIDITRLDGKNGRREAGIRHHRGRLDVTEVVWVNGVPVTPAARAAVEVTTVLPVEPALVLVNGLLHSGATTPAEVDAEVERLREWPGTLHTRLVQSLSDPRVQSVAESRTLYLCWSQHLPRPEPQVPIVDEWGQVFAYADFAWKSRGVFLEFDGRIKYERFRRKGESLEDYVLREKRREELICQVTGWVCIRITWQDLAHPRRTAQRIMRILASRG
jgi:hypothetical protein